MVKVRQKVKIRADISRVWEALTKPSDVLAWHENVTGLTGHPQDYPSVNKIYCWKYRWGPFLMNLYDQPTVIIPRQQYAAQGRIFLFQWAVCFLLKALDGFVEVDMELEMASRAPMIGGVIELLFGKMLAEQEVHQLLRHLTRYCESLPIAPPTTQ
jgi:hypothetical protein